MVQLPDDVENAGYVRSKHNRFEFEQVFYSRKHGFIGTEQEFVKKGIAYIYKQIDQYRRIKHDTEYRS
jgi:hypothetical protein